MRILIVEDEKRLAGTLQELLHRQGYTADVCYDGISGLDDARSDIYDLLVLDAMLPGMDGFTVCLRLAAAEKLLGGSFSLQIAISLTLTAVLEASDYDKNLLLEGGALNHLAKLQKR